MFEHFRLHVLVEHGNLAVTLSTNSDENQRSLALVGVSSARTAVASNISAVEKVDGEALSAMSTSASPQSTWASQPGSNSNGRYTWRTTARLAVIADIDMDTRFKLSA